MPTMTLPRDGLLHSMKLAITPKSEPVSAEFPLTLDLRRAD
jgi:hypothetical protein